MNSKTVVPLLGGVVGAIACFAVSAGAADLPAGTVISAENLDQIKDQTFQGTRIGDLITPTFEMWIRKYGLKMPLAPTSNVKLDPLYLKATADNAGKAKLDASHKISGYVSGIPFPNLDIKDPDCGWKAAWNQYLSDPMIGDSWFADAQVTILDANSGIIDKFGAASAKSIFEGRTIGPAKIGEAKDHAKYLLVLTSPYDIAGLGVFNAQYNDGTSDDGWVYIRNLRRVRRTSGAGSWMDPQPKMDLLNDDNQGLLGYPLWFKDFKCVAKRKVLAVLTGPDPNAPHAVTDQIDTSKAPYWNPTNQVWEPREVIVVEATPPDEHPYGKKVLYQDVLFPKFYHGELYDHKGEFWRLWRQSYRQAPNGNGAPGIQLVHTQAIDFQRLRATNIDMTFTKTNLLGPEWFSEATLEKAAGGALFAEIQKMK